MKGRELIRRIDDIHENRKIPKDNIYRGIEDSLRELLRAELSEKVTDSFSVSIEKKADTKKKRKKGDVIAKHNKEEIDSEIVTRLIPQAVRRAELQVIGQEMLKLAGTIEEVRKIPQETVLAGIEDALILAIQKHYNDKTTDEIILSINRDNGVIIARREEVDIEPELLGRIAAQSAKQLLIQKFREAESQAVFDEFAAQKGDMVRGKIQRFEHGSAIVTLDHSRSEAILPRSEQIPGETLHPDDRIEAVILDVRKNGHRVKIVLSRTHPEYVHQLFQREIPEIKERVIEVRAVSREAGYRSKVAVSSIDVKVDCVGACVGVRGSRIKNIVDALGGSERIDIVRWNDSLQVLIPNALQPAEIEEVFLYPRLGRAIVLVQDDQLSLAIGRRGQNVRLASKLVGWDIEIMTHDELNDSIERAEDWFMGMPHASAEMVEVLIEEGFLSFDDISYGLETFELAELVNITEEQAVEVVEYAEEAGEQLEEETRSRPPVQKQPPAVTERPAESATQMFGEKTEQPQEESSEARQSFESLFREETPVAEEEEVQADESTVVEEHPDGSPVEDSLESDEGDESEEEEEGSAEDAEHLGASFVGEHGIESDTEANESPVHHEPEEEHSKIEMESDEEAQGFSPGEEAYIEAVEDGEPGPGETTPVTPPEQSSDDEK